MFNLYKAQSGVTLIETVIYIGIVSIVVVGIISVVIQLVTLKSRADAYSLISAEASNVFEKMINDVRDGDSFRLIDQHTLEVTNDAEIKEIYFQDNRVWVFEDGVEYELTSNLVKVNNLTFADWTSTNSDALIHVILEVQKGDVNETFQTGIHQR